MKKLRLLVFLLPCLLLVNCNEQDEIEFYQLFPNGYFETGFREEYIMTGISNLGTTFTGTHFELTMSPETINGELLIPIRSQNDYKDDQDNVFVNGAIAYYSPNDKERTLLASEDLLTQDFLTNLDMQVIPKTAKIGESGSIHRLADSFGNVVTSTWELTTLDEKVWLVLATESKDVAGNLFLEGNISYEIEADGSRKSITIFFDYKPFNDPVNWVGTK